MKEKLAQLKRDLPAVYLALKDKETPWTARILAALTVGYALSPVDLIPDFIPVLGLLDDVVLLPLLVSFTVRLIPGDVFERCRLESEGMWKDGKPKKWYYALPILVLWILLILWIIRLVRSR